MQSGLSSVIIALISTKGSSSMTVRYALPTDLAALAAVEAECFPAAEAASEKDIKNRLDHYANHFWLLFDGDKLVSFVRSIQTTKADIVRVEDITKYKAEERPQGIVERKMHTRLEGTVDVKNLRFGYNSLQEPIVSDVSFKVECGTSVALVGGSGSGKSTICYQFVIFL